MKYIHSIYTVYMYIYIKIILDYIIKILINEIDSTNY